MTTPKNLTAKPQVCEAIKRRLAKSEPSTLEELMDSVADDCGIGLEELVPETILAIASLMISEEICKYVDPRLEYALDYSWLLGEELITK